MNGPPGLASEELFVPPHTYVKLPGGTHGLLPRGKSWVALGSGAAGGLGNALLGPFGGTDPGDLLASLTAVSSNVSKLGAATVRGVPVTRLRLDVDPAKAASRVPRGQRAGFRAFAASLGAYHDPGGRMGGPAEQGAAGTVVAAPARRYGRHRRHPFHPNRRFLRLWRGGAAFRPRRRARSPASPTSATAWRQISHYRHQRYRRGRRAPPGRCHQPRRQPRPRSSARSGWRWGVTTRKRPRARCSQHSAPASCR